MDDPYKTLGIGKDAKAEEIKKKYRKLARELHPDLHPGDKKAEARFKDVSAAYDLLSDKDKRAAFDRGEIDAAGQPRQERTFYRSYAGGGPGGRYHDPSEHFSDFAADDLFANLFRRAGGGPGEGMRFRGADSHYRLAIDFIDAVKGGVKELSLPGGKTLRVTIPPGCEDGQTLRLKGQGMPGAGGGPAGDAAIELTVRPHPQFSRKGDDIHIELPITLPEAVLGGRVEVPTVDGPVTMTVPKGANSGTVLRLREKGVPPGGNSATARRGDQYVTLKVMLPAKPDKELEEAVAAWAKAHPYEVRGKQRETS